MQALISLPIVSRDEQEWQRLILRKVSGIPLLPRVIATASRGGATSFLIVLPSALHDQLMAHLQSPLLSSLSIRIVAVDQGFDANNLAHWQLLKDYLEPRFLWLPWNHVTVRSTISSIIAAGKEGQEGVGFLSPRTSSGTPKKPVPHQNETDMERPAVVIAQKLLDPYHGQLAQYLAASSLRRIALPHYPGISVNSSRARRRKAERLLVRGSGKTSDGIYSKFNRRLCRPAVRWLSKMPVTANMVTWAGLPVIFLSGYWYSEGYWRAYVIGGLLYFVSVLMDEIDGMLARTKFQESPFGCWLETFIDYTSYLILWSGISIGLYRQYGAIWLMLGGLTILSNVVIFFVLLRQRKTIASDKPNEYHNRFNGRLEADSGSLISRMIRKVAFLAKRGVMAHYLLLFSILGLLRVMFLLVVTGSILTLLIVFYMNRLFRSRILSALAPGQVVHLR